jgi:hypothetical protein
MLLSALFFTAFLTLHSQVVTPVGRSVIAGGVGGSRSIVDGGPGTNRVLNPASVVEHPTWGIIFTDQFGAYKVAPSTGIPVFYPRSVIRHISTNGVVTTIVGTQAGGDYYSKDGSGTNVVLQRAQSLAIDPSTRRTFFCDRSAIRELWGKTNVTLFCGTYGENWGLPMTGPRTNVHIPELSCITFNREGEMLIGGGL